MSADLETILVYLQRRYNILREVCSLTEELAEAVQAALQQLPDELREALTDTFWFDKPVDARLRNAALKALRTPTVCQTLRAYV